MIFYLFKQGWAANRRKKGTSSRWNRALNLWQSRKETFQFWTVLMRTVPLTTSHGTGNILAKDLNYWSQHVLVQLQRKMEDWEFSSVKVPNMCPCTSRLPSLETQPPTSVQQVQMLSRHLQPVPKPAAEAPAKPCCVDEIVTHTHKHTHNLFKKTEIMQNLFFHQNAIAIENQTQNKVSRNFQIFEIYALNFKITLGLISNYNGY